MTLFLLLTLLIVPMHAQEDTSSVSQDSKAQFLKNMTFDDVYMLIGYMSVFKVHYQPEKEETLSIMTDIIRNEADTIYASAYNKCTFSGAAEHYSYLSQQAVRPFIVRDLFDIALYRLIYGMTFQKALYLDPHSEEVLIFKNIQTPREFDEVHAWIQKHNVSVSLSLFPTSVREKALAYAKQLTFDESIMWLMGSSVQKKYNEPVGGVLAAIMTVENLNQTMRAVIEQQEQPERRALLRFIWTDQEIMNLRINTK